jgi:hypothetical protein
MYLITDPMAIDAVDYFEVDIDGSVVRSDGEVAGSEVRLHYELDPGLSLGTHTAIITAMNAWGAGEPSDPFGFVKGLPGKPSGVGLAEA